MKKSLQSGCIGIIARLGSKRLTDKHLIKINKQPIITYLIRRIKNHFIKEINQHDLRIFILTGEENINKRLGALTEECGISIYYGDNKNIPNRMLEVINKYLFDYIITVDGDDVLCALEGIRKIYDSIHSGNKYVKTINYPFGMNSMGMTKVFLENSLQGREKQNLETGWGWIFNENECKNIGHSTKVDERLRFSLDYPEDLSFFKKLIQSELDILNKNTAEIIDFVIKKKIFLENMHLNNEYWENFRTQKSSEIKGVING
tara:strand:- start:1101 stop:1883 length:783 start_codon:yes stop_codon:yes gene_type:complete